MQINGETVTFDSESPLTGKELMLGLLIQNMPDELKIVSGLRLLESRSGKSVEWWLEQDTTTLAKAMNECGLAMSVAIEVNEVIRKLD